LTTQTNQHNQHQTRLLWHYFLVTYIAVLVNVAAYLQEIDYSGRVTLFFVAAVYLTYALLYLLPALAFLLCLDRLLFLRIVRALLGRTPIASAWIVRCAAVLTFGAVQVILFGNHFIFHMYGFHINGFVYNLLNTRGGIESLGGEGSTTISFTLIIVGILFVQALLLGLVLAWPRLRRNLDRFSTRRAIIALAVLAVALGGFERITYGICRLRGYRPPVLASNAFPLYQPTTFAKLAKSFGIASKEERNLHFKTQTTGLQYPLHPIRWEPVSKPYNIVFLVAESLRADMLEPEIMPQAWALAQKANWFRQHYSGGNGTRMAMFSMFYGMYGSYWFSFLEQNRGPVLIDTLIDQNYQMKMFTSARFTYPEFDKTIFARIPRERLHEGAAQPKWRRDQENTALLLDFIEHRDRNRPFMTFLFFESAHASYYFPNDTIIRTPYVKDLNYATMDVKKDSQLIKNRYINACNHLDTQFNRIYKYLQEHDLIESTIVVVTGDHGEEFMEKGHWGHNSTFDEEQTRTPFVLWVPGKPRREVTHMSSHMDIPATLMPLLGVTNPPEDYSLGYDLLGTKVREYSVLCNWQSLAYVDSSYKAVFPINAYGFMQQIITTKNDEPVADQSSFLAHSQPQLIEIMKKMKLFNRLAPPPT